MSTNISGRAYPDRRHQLDRAELLARYGGTGDSALDIIGAVLAERYSCRSYRPEPVPHDVIRRLVGLAQLSASWCNSQPWKVIITEGEGTRRYADALYAEALSRPTENDADISFPSTYSGVYNTRRRETAWQLYESVGIPYGDRAASLTQTLENFRLFGAPHALLLTSERELGGYGVLDCGIFLGNFLTLAQAAGIGAIAQASLATYGSFTRRFFGIPENRVIVGGVSFGYPAEEHPANSFRTERAFEEEVIDWYSE